MRARPTQPDIRVTLSVTEARTIELALAVLRTSKCAEMLKPNETETLFQLHQQLGDALGTVDELARKAL